MSNEQDATAQVWLDSAAQKSRRRDDEGAIADLTEAIQLKPNWVEAYLHRATAYFNMGNRDASLADAQEAARIEPNNVHAQDWLKLIQQVPTRRSEIFERMAGGRDKALLNPQIAKLYSMLRGSDSLKSGDEQIVHEFDGIIQTDPAKGYFARGNFYDARGEREKAVADYSEAIRFDPNFAGAYRSRAMSYGGYGHFNEAVADYTRTLELYDQQQEHDFNKATIYYLRGSLRGHTGDPQEAVADLTEAIRLRSDYTDAYFERGILRENHGDLEGAIADWQQYLDLAAAEERERGDQAEVEEWIREAKIKLNQK